jgi:hypothetical protein
MTPFSTEVQKINVVLVILQHHFISSIPDGMVLTSATPFY